GRPAPDHAQAGRLQDFDAAGCGGRQGSGARCARHRREGAGRAHRRADAFHRRAARAGAPARTGPRPLLMAHPGKAISGTAFATLLLIALMMGANHVAARIAFNNGVDVATAVVFRSAITALVLVVLLRLQRVRVRFTPRHWQMLPAIGLLVGIQSLCLYSSVARLPVALALVITQHETTEVDGRVRTASTMSIAGLVALATVALQGGFHLPTASPGWWGLATLTFLYGTAFTIMFPVLPRLGVVGNSAIMNVEPVFALALAWLILGQAIAPVQVIGALIVVGAVMALGMRKR